MRNDKIISVLLIGAAVGAVAGLLFTDKGKQLQGKLKEQSGGLFNSLCEAVDKGKEMLTSYADKFASTAGEAENKVKQIASHNNVTS